VRALIFRFLLATAFLLAAPKAKSAPELCQQLQEELRTLIESANYCANKNDCAVESKISVNSLCKIQPLINKKHALGPLQKKREKYLKECPQAVSCVYQSQDEKILGCYKEKCLFRIDEVREIAKSFKIGTSKSDIEKIFKTPDGGLTAVGIVRYYEEPGILIEVHFDNKNRLSAPLKVYPGNFHVD